MPDYKEIKALAVFAATAFLLPLLCVAATARSPGAADSGFNLIIYGIEAASPSAAAIAAVMLISGRKGVIDFFRTSFTPKMKINAISTPILLAFGIMLAARGLASFFMEASFQINPLSGKKLVIIGWSFAAEELGWRGFLHKRLASAVPERLAPLIVGIIWSAWHYPYFITGRNEVPLALFVAGCIADSYIYLFLLKLSGGNVLIAMLYHMAGNLFINLFSINPGLNGGSAVPYLISVILTGLLGIGLNMLNKRAASAQGARKREGFS